MTLAQITIPGTTFELPVEVLVLGLITGLTYSLLGMGLTLVYKSARVLNFAQGEMGALPAILVPVLVINQGWSYWLAALVALAVAATVGVLLETLVIHPLSRAARLTVMVATIGAAQVLFGIGVLIPRGGELGASLFPAPFEASASLGNLRLGAGHLMIIVAVPLIAAALSVFFKLGKLGKASRAQAENQEAAQLAGVPIRLVSLGVWVLVGVLAGLSGILSGPTRPIAIGIALGPQLMLRALGAAMIGGLTNLPGVFAGGIAIGVIEGLVSWNYPTGGVLELVLFLVIVAALVGRRSLGGLARAAQHSSWTLATSVRSLDPDVARLPRIRAARATGLAALLVGAIVFPLALSSAHRFLMSSVVLFAIMGLSLVILTGFAGQVSLGQFAFVALGAMVGGRLHQLGYPSWTAVLYATLAGAVVALLIGIPALRIRGLFLAVTTLGFAVAASGWLLNQRWLVSHAGGTSLQIPRPQWLGIDFASDLNFYWLCLTLLVAAGAAVHHFRRTGVGRTLVAVRDNEPSAAALSVSPARAKLTAFMVAGAIAALAGYFYGALLGSFSSNASSTFGPEQSLLLVSMVIFGGVTSVTGAVLGALWVRGIPFLFGSTAGLLSSGLGLLVVLLFVPGGLASIAFAVRDGVVRLLAGEGVSRDGREPPMLIARSSDARGGRPRSSPGMAVEARDVVVRFGGNTAVAGASIHARPGEIVGLMGPNGAGKTTLFNVLSGQLRPASGRVFLDGREITDLPPQARARLGLGRTFQQARLFDEMTVLEVFKVALEREEASEVVPSLLGLPPSWRAERRKQLRAHELLELLGLEQAGHRRVTELSTGTRRFVELGSTLALGARALLLDEPTAGFPQDEVERFRPVLREVRDYLGATMVVIDHDVPMIESLVDRLYVLSAGEVIAEGLPRLLREDPGVIAAYLGTDERAISRSGERAADTATTVG